MAQRAQFNPLQPPNYVPPSKGIVWVLWVCDRRGARRGRYRALVLAVSLPCVTDRAEAALLLSYGRLRLTLVVLCSSARDSRLISAIQRPASGS